MSMTQEKLAAVIMEELLRQGDDPMLGRPYVSEREEEVLLDGNFDIQALAAAILAKVQGQPLPPERNSGTNA